MQTYDEARLFCLIDEFKSADSIQSVRCGQMEVHTMNKGDDVLQIEIVGSVGEVTLNGEKVYEYLRFEHLI